MRTGAIFARGSCRALKWMALVGVVFALGAVEAAAQTTFTAGRMTIAAEDSSEGGYTDVTVTLRAEVPGTNTNADPIVPTPGGIIRVTVTVAPLDRSVAAELAKLDEFDATPADNGDWEIADSISQAGATTKTLDFKFPDNANAESAPHTLMEKFRLHTATPDDDAEHEALKVEFTSLEGVVDPNDPDDTAPSGVNSPSDSALAPADVDTKYIRITDIDRQRYVLTIDTASPSEGGGITATIKADPQHVQGSQALTFTADMPELGYTIVVTGPASASGNTVTLGSADGSTLAVGTARDTANMATVTLTTTVENDGNRVTDTLTLSARKGPGVPVEDDSEKQIDISDLHALPMVKMILVDPQGDALNPQPTTVTEGMDYDVKLIVVDEDGMAVTSRTGEALMATLMSTGDAVRDGDWSLDGYPIFRIDEDAVASEMAELQIDRDDDLDNESLMLSATVTGNDAMYGDPQPGLNPIMDVLSLTIVDDSLILVRAADGAMQAIYGAIDEAEGEDELLSRGEQVRIPKSALFTAETGYTVQIAPETSNADIVAVYDGDDATNNPESTWAGNIVVVPRTLGTAKITLIATAVDASSSFNATQLTPNSAQIEFEVTVSLAVPGPPRNLRPTEEGDGEVLLEWDAPSTGGAPTGYHGRIDAGEWVAVAAAPDTDWRATGLTNGEDYIFEVRAYNDAGESDAVSVKATPMATPVDASQEVTVKSVSAATSVAESGGLEVTVTANVPAGTKGADGKVAAIASKQVMVSFPTDDGSIQAGEDADAGELTPLGATNGAYTWTNIPREEKKRDDITYTFRVAVGQDLDAEDEKFQVHVWIDGDGEKSEVVTIDDAQEQKYTLSLPAAEKGAITEGKSAKLTLKADPARTLDIPVTLALEPNDPSRYTLDPANGMFGTTSLVTNVSTKADSDRADDTLTVTAYTDRHGEFASLDITITDANALPAVKATLVDDKGKALDPEPESVMEGESVHVMLTAVDKDGKNMKAAEKLTITLMPTGTADAQDYRLSSQSFEIASGKESSAAVELMVTEDQDIGEETLMFDAAVAGESKNGTEKRSVAGVLSLMITDGTEKLVWAKTQEEVEAAVYAAKNAGAGDDMTFTAGEMIEVMGNALFSSAEGVTPSYTAESDMSDVASVSVSGGTVMVTAVAEGMAHITITAHGNMPSGVKILDQTDPGMASVMFPVEVGLEALSIMLSGPEDMNLAEGMSAMVTATANREVSADTMVMLMRDRAMSTAGDADYDAEAITIAAGEMMGSTMVMAVEDNMMEDMEELVLYGMTEGMAGEVTGEVKLYLWDAAVPALPVIAQLLLAALMALGGYRRYRRR